MAETIVTQNEVFYIPFTASPTAGSATLLLFVSGDAGRSWQLYQQQPASAGKFSFRAAVDGEFWFAVRVAGQDPDPAKSIESPELKVAVDRRRPTLTVVAGKAASGQVVCRWSAEDPHFDYDSTKIEYQIAGQSQWYPATDHNVEPTVDVDPRQQVASGHAILPGLTLGQTIRLRVSVRDAAGNESSTEREYDPSALSLVTDLHAPLPPDAAQSDQGQQIPGISGGTRSTAQLPINVAQAPPVLHGDSTYGWDSSTNEPERSRPDTSQMVTNNTIKQGGITPQAPPLAFPPPPISPSLPLVASNAANPGIITRNRPSIANEGDVADEQAPPTSHPAVTPESPVSERKNFNESSLGDSTSSAIQTGQRMSKSRRFEIDYDLQDVSFGSVHRVEVWFTADGGRTWRHHGDDEDRKSPYLMQVDGDGLYGIRLLIQTRVGYNVRPPATGDPADIWINVDSTPPIARITSVEYGRDSSAGQLEIHWDAQDPNLADNPITLLFSDSTEGPWRRVVVDLPNTGMYGWPIDDRAPPKIFLRLEVRDKAGNITLDTPSTPVNNVRAVPRGQIIDIRPAQSPGQNIRR